MVQRVRPLLAALPPIVAVSLSMAAIAGCGGDDGEGAAGDALAVAIASEPPRNFIERVAKLLETTTKKKDCAQLEEVNGRSYSRFACPPARSIRESMKSFEVVGAKTYGTGALVDYRSGEVPDGAAILLFVSPDREWGISRFGVVTKPSTESSDEKSRAGYDAAIEKYIRAVRQRDCDTFAAVTFTDGAKRAQVCGTLFARTASLAKRLKADRSARPVYQGGNATYGFYTLETAKPAPENVTLSVVSAGAGSKEPYVILDVVPGPTAADQREVRREFERQLEEKKDGSSGTKPSDPAVTTP